MTKLINVMKMAGLKPIPSLEEQKERVNKLELLTKQCEAHAVNMYLSDHNGIDINNPSLLPITNPDYVPPTKAQVAAVVDLLISKGMARTDISKMLGISPTGNRTLNYWVTDSRDTQIPYCAWRQLTTLAGLTMVTMVESK